MQIDKHEIKRLYMTNKDGTYVHYCRCNPDTLEYEELPKDYIKLDVLHVENYWFRRGKEINIDIEMVRRVQRELHHTDAKKRVCQCAYKKPSIIYINDIPYDVCNGCKLYIE